MSREQFKKIKKYWDDARTVSLKDKYLKDLEVSQIKEFIDQIEFKKKIKLELGCGDGEGTRFYKEKDDLYVAVDYSWTMLQKAKKNVNQKRIFYIQADVRELPFKNHSFEVIISERCLINLPEKEQQYQTIRNISDLLAPKGYYIFVEGTRQGLEHLNLLRKRVQLEPIEMPWHNIFFDETELIPFLEKHYWILEKGSFWFYYIGSRVINPANEYPDSPKYDSPVNRISHQVSKGIQEELGSVFSLSQSIGQIFFLLLEKAQ